MHASRVNKHTHLTLCLVMILLAFNVRAQQPAATPTVTIDLMSFNIRYGKAKDGLDRWGLRRGRVYHVIQRHRPDVVGLQEALRFQIDDIRRGVPGYAEVGVGREGGDEGEFSAILYRNDRLELGASGTFWLSDTPGVPSRNWGNGLNRICTWARFVEKTTGRAFYVFNTHFDHRSQPSRENAAAQIAAHIAARQDAGPVFLMGDLNADESNPAIAYFKGEREHGGARTPRPLVDAYRVLHPEATHVGTFNGFKDGWDTARKIDYIFVESGALQDKTVLVQSAEILMDRVDGRWPSDHFAVTARLVIGD